MSPALLETGFYQMDQKYRHQLALNHWIHITLGIQTVGLNITNSPKLPIGIYHCEMMDRENVTHYLYAGIYLENEDMTLCWDN